MAGLEVQLFHADDTDAAIAVAKTDAKGQYRFARLYPGEALALSADVVPAWADDLSITWSSTDEAVATVNADGLATAVAPGVCEIVARSANGCEDRCALSVAPVDSD